MTCEHCHRAVRRVVIHGRELWCGPCATDDTPLVHGVIGDDIPGGFVQENFGPEPEVFYSKKAMALRAKELGLLPFVRWSGPNDRHVAKWSTMDPYTLAAAEALVARTK